MAVRVSKYDPALRRGNGGLSAPVWTSIADIGKEFDGSVLTQEGYLRVESGYVSVLLSFLRDAGSPDLLVRELEVIRRPSGRALREQPAVAEDLYEGEVVPPGDVAPVVRACLREHFWCKLLSRDTFGFHFGYDYYVYVVGMLASEHTRRIAAETGLFLETMPSPYD